MKLRIMNYELRKYLSLVFIVFLIIAIFSPLFTTASAGKWGGVDESVVEKFAEEHGRPSREPYINTDQGDLLLFMFLIGGIVGGFAAGYYWRTLTETGPQKSVCCNAKENADGSV